MIPFLLFTLKISTFIAELFQNSWNRLSDTEITPFFNGGKNERNLRKKIKYHNECWTVHTERMKNVMESGILHKKMIPYRKKAMNRLAKETTNSAFRQRWKRVRPKQAKMPREGDEKKNFARFCTTFELSETKAKK